jgi:FtsP/CotA-like multicopper oxidase with cupredoxin domain
MRRRLFLQALAAVPMLAGAAEPSSKAFELAIAKGRVDPAQATVRVKKGDKVELRWTSDRPIGLHLHGYDLQATVTPQSPRTMSFTANITGRFPVSEHRQGGALERAVLYLEVHP